MGQPFKLETGLPTRPASVINMSTTLLQEKEVHVLKKGSKYIPKPPKLQKNDLMSTFNKYARRIKLQYFWHNKDKSNAIKPKFKIPSTWTPKNEDIDERVLKILNQLQQQLNRVKLTNKVHNNHHTQKEIRLLKLLSNNHNIIIKPADKGSSLLILNTEDYSREAHRQLSNQLHYRPLQGPISHKDHEVINTILTSLHHSKYLTKKELDFIKPDEDARPRLIYFLPKIHKDPSSWPLHHIPPGRPIVSDVGSNNYNLSKIIDHYLEPFSKIHPSFIKDTPDFLTKITRNQVPQSAYLITLDVEALYTNIDNTEGIKAIQEIIKDHPDSTRPDKEMISLLQLSLKNNDFKFGEQWFLQTYGCSMGKKFSPHYADIFMANFEKKALTKCTYKPHTYFRFLDDIFIVWTHSLDQFQTFFNTFNTHHPTIKFKATINSNSIDFLDVTIFKGPNFENNNILDTKVHFKPTDTHELLHKSSYHPPHTFKGIIKSQIIRFHRISSHPKDFQLACDTVFPVLYKRNYKEKFIKEVLQETTNQIKQQQTTHNLITKCDSARCGIHQYFDPLNNLCYHGNTYNITDKMSCSSRNVIYSLRCTLCSKIYIGQTKNTLRERFYAHKSTIVHNKNKSFAKHVRKCMTRCNRDITAPLPVRITPIKLIPLNDDPELNTIDLINEETKLITLLKTTEPGGINVPTDAQEPIPVILRFSDSTKTITKLFREAHTKLQLRFKGIFRRKPIIAHMKNKNISDYVVRTQLKPESLPQVH